MAVTAVPGRGECGWIDEFAGVGGGERGKERLVGAEAVVVVLGHGLRVDVTLRGGSGVKLGVRVAGAQGHDAATEASTKQGTDDNACYSLRGKP